MIHASNKLSLSAFTWSMLWSLAIKLSALFQHTLCLFLSLVFSVYAFCNLFFVFGARISVVFVDMKLEIENQFFSGLLWTFVTNVHLL